MEHIALNQLAQLVYDYCGLNYLKNISGLEMKISRHLKELQMTTIWSYIHYLEQTQEEWEQLVELLTINETYFYREDKQLVVYQESILPELRKKEASKPIKVWSAACSTGEEPYSLGIMTMSSKAYEENLVEITATDINKRVLKTAEDGKYYKKSLSFRRIPELWKENYFINNPDYYEVLPELKKMVNFKYKNLLDKTNEKMEEEYDVIFCRNVLIYFDENTIKKVVTDFYHALKKGGYLFLGHAETIAKLDIGFETLNTNGTFYYRKG